MITMRAAFSYDCIATFVYPCVLTASQFTDKERDTESGLDYFGARYYGSNMGRFMSPDWADTPMAVPHSALNDPQSLNLYGYVLNNPLRRADPDGHEPGDHGAAWDQFDMNVLAASGGNAEFTFGNMGEGTEAIGKAAQNWANVFDKLWQNYPSHAAYGSGTAGSSGSSIQSATGIDVVDTCALRMSYALNHSGFSIGKKDGKSAMTGTDGSTYLVSQADVGRFITRNLFAPQQIALSAVGGFDQNFAQASGIVRFNIHFATGTATGHIALFQNGSYHEGEDDYTTPDPGHYTVRGIDFWRMK